MPFKIAVSVGHNPKAPGYKVGTTSEYSEMAVVAGLLVREIQLTGHQAFLIQSHNLDVKVSQINNIRCDCAIELHLNAANEEAKGFETLYCPGSIAGLQLANSIHDSVSHVMGSRNRGVKEGWWRMIVDGDKDFFLAKTNCPAVITEAYFLDNDEERERYVGNLNWCHQFAQKIAVGIILNLNGIKP